VPEQIRKTRRSLLRESLRILVQILKILALYFLFHRSLNANYSPDLKLAFLGKNDPLKFLSLKSRIKSMCVWLESEKFRADLFKTAGLVLCTPFLSILFIFLTNPNLSFANFNLLKLLFCVLIFLIGIFVFAYSHSILMHLDQRLEVVNNAKS
jgi:hypothetical protein